ncbi:hypothetical protein AVEN_31259-1 [Araneus ventricosus]|uniref:Uncharacterized protein n=1 Tax=Araneus ventricosus TaxID=182803 RepID=A0A4Y2CDM6_ARAVE|nr:hypothetical protein AVEN_31259-1 [Araneus ventricosus]
MSVATGVTGNVGKINCYDALNIGAIMMGKKVGDNFHDIQYSRGDRVLSLKIVNAHVTIHGVTVTVDPLLLFQRFSIIKRSDDDLRECLNFELALYPVTLFDDTGMRKTKKSSLFDSFNPIDIHPDFETANYVIDGGFLLHRVLWHQNDSFLKICNKCVSNVQNNYDQNCVIVFDGYSSNQRNVKAMEQLRRCSLRRYDCDLGPRKIPH